MSNDQKTDAFRPFLSDPAPRTREAQERWRQGKVNIVDEMAKLEEELTEEIRNLRNKLDCAMWILDNKEEQIKDLECAIGKIVEPHNPTPNAPACQ